jgi:hypothetical protein
MSNSSVKPCKPPKDPIKTVYQGTCPRLSTRGVGNLSYELGNDEAGNGHNAVDHQEGSMIDLADESFGKQRLTFESVSDSMQLKQTGVSNKYTHRLTASNNYPADLTAKPNGAQITQLTH